MFIEVLVVGIGFLTGLAVLAAAIAGSETASRMAHAADSTAAAGAALAGAYALGILLDRTADTVLSPVRRRLRNASFASDSAYAQARLSLAAQPALAARADYARSRMRICRGWLLNSALLTTATDLALLRYHTDQHALLIGLTTSFGLLITLGFYLAWRAITATSYRKLAEQTGSLAAALPPQPIPTQPSAPVQTTT
ncbi:hypothetical protein G7Z12_37720 [Streptomyces sp. ID38640]|uniref:hypothetical protein n=1 Tax=Streptomyces sp. ID38640 TaxID=1265399 RepID=UPI00140ED84D|nr:hypothetical protein [Streptomyces sp. ID38640]QIK04709.1 hypothetical protein G7Z12_00020 [Streptomyces sp. ID38640]QIK10874.1 hypothetical protein G7Z12_37315 [Streptomyces sp. ID38640]QIK10937.1 hypothetical protein G7Z12_37720 [Streptomyces sp. ID38640]